MNWGRFEQAGVARRTIRISNIARGPGRTLAYTLDLTGAGGLFYYDLDRRLERRLMHRNGFVSHGLGARPSDGLLAFSMPAEDGSSGIAVGERDGVFVRRITAGDSRDEAPTWWLDGETPWLYFHSAGMCRTEGGVPLGLGHCEICRVNFSGGEIETVLQSPDFDFIQPRVAADGTLYCIRRPHQPPGPKPVGTWTMVKEVLLLPFALARVVFYFANFMSVMFAGRPLTSSTLNPINARDPQQLQQIRIWGQMVDTQKAIGKASTDSRLRLVPDGWQLVRKKVGQPLEELVRHVLCFDLGADGEVVYSDGGGIYQWTSDGEKQLSKATHVMQLAIVKNPT